MGGTKRYVKKITDKKDDKLDIKLKINEGGLKDKALDKKRGIPEDDATKRAKVKGVLKPKMTSMSTPPSRKMFGLK